MLFSDHNVLEFEMISYQDAHFETSRSWSFNSTQWYDSTRSWNLSFVRVRGGNVYYVEVEVEVEVLLAVVVALVGCT